MCVSIRQEHIAIDGLLCVSIRQERIAIYGPLCLNIIQDHITVDGMLCLGITQEHITLADPLSFSTLYQQSERVYGRDKLCTRPGSRPTAPPTTTRA